ncbi:MAG: hypothetical protein K2X03_30450 [Bryobacteraceae bacterium]|nr:hypothetical protein [Bryobacteraceae bacterium]
MRCFLIFALALPGFGQTYSPPYYAITTLAGARPTGDGGPATDALLLNPEFLLSDASGNHYVVDSGQHRIRRFSTGGTITTIAGNGIAGYSGDNGLATAAQLNTPTTLALDASAGLLYIADSGNHAIRVLTLSTGVIRTLAGGTPGFADGALAQARFTSPYGLALDASNNIVITDSGNHRLRRIAGGQVSTISGTGVAGFFGDDTNALVARMTLPRAIVLGADNALYFTDSGNRLIRRILPNGTIQTYAGKGAEVNTGNGDGGPALTSLVDAAGLAADTNGDLLIADAEGNRLRRIASRTGLISTIVGNGEIGFAGDGQAAILARLQSPSSIFVDARGNLNFVDRGNHRIRRVINSSDATGGRTETIAGRGYSGGDGGPATTAQLLFPEAAIAGPGNAIFIADTGNHCVRRVALDGTISTFAGRCGLPGNTGDGGTATGALLNQPAGLVFDNENSLFIADRGNDRIRRVQANGTITTLVGANNNVRRPQGLALDPIVPRYVYFTNEFGGTRLSRLDIVRQDVATMAGGTNNESGSSGDGGAAGVALLNGPSDVATDARGNIFIADRNNGRVRRIDAASGLINTVLTASGLARVAVDSSGALFVTQAAADQHRLRRGAETLAGGSLPGFGGDGLFSAAAALDTPAGVSVLPDGRLLLADRANQRVRVLTPRALQVIEVQAGNGQTAAPGAVLPNPLAARVLLTGGIAVPGVTVGFAVESGQAALAATSAVTDANGIATMQLTFGPVAGPVIVVATVPGLTPARFTLTASGPIGAVRPRINPGGIVGVGLSVPRISAASPNALVSIFGSNFLATGTGRRVNADELVGGRLPGALLGVCVTFDGVRAAMLDVFPSQLTVQVPPLLTAAATTVVRVQTSCGTANELSSDGEPMPFALASPEFLFFVTNTNGINPVAAVDAATGGLVGPTDVLGGALTPARPGDVVTVYMSGLGPVTPALATGEIPRAAAPVTSPVVVRLGDLTLAPSDVLYAGASPSLVIYQVNFRIPAQAPAGNLPLSVSVGGALTPPGGYLAVRRF